MYGIRCLEVDNTVFSHPVRCKLCLHYARRTANGIVDLLCKFKSCLATSFSRFTPRHSQLVAMLGAARTRCAQTSCHLLPSIARLLIVPPNAALPPLAGNYLCNGILRELYVYNGNFKEKPAPLKDTAWSLLIFGLSERKILANERAETCLHAQRVQQNLQEVNVRPLVRCSLKASD